MAKLKPTPELIEGILARIPEGFISRSKLEARIGGHKRSNSAIEGALRRGKVAMDGKYCYDSTRITLAQVHELATWCDPALPTLSKDGDLPEAPVVERRKAHIEILWQFDDPAAYQQIMDALTRGYTTIQELCQSPADEAIIKNLLGAGLLRQREAIVYDPLRLSASTIDRINRRQQIEALRQQLSDYLREKPGQTAARAELEKKFGGNHFRETLAAGGFVIFKVYVRQLHDAVVWVRLKSADPAQAEKIAHAAYKIPDEAWEPILALCGDVVRPQARDGKTYRTRVMAHSYTLKSAARRLGVRPETLENAIKNKIIPCFKDPEDSLRLPAAEVEAALANPEYGEKITATEPVKVRYLALVAGASYSTIYRRLRQAGISRSEPQWGQVRGKWGLPDSLREFKAILKEAIERQRAALAAEYAEQQRRWQEQHELDRKRREELRARLVAAFPTWRHEGRTEQHITLHIGAPNSGKTHDALQALIESGRGWYLAPLRLLAFEIFDELNQQGVYCNLLTGEEYIPVPGATITAATIEMFNPKHSGTCIIIDEAQMLADPDRGWAWTRALMEAEAPEIHVIGPPTIAQLVEKLAAAAAMPISVLEHERLAPIRVAEKPWRLHELPPSTILVAFSRAMVLELKTELEKARRRVSVIYGNLPPEVRRKQVRRFTNGQTDICVATDAVGMGINLPADYVCFYEVEKFDGKQTRRLTPNEIQQIGGRAGRYGLSKSGEVGATNKQNLKLVRSLFYAPPLEPAYARVAPTAEDLVLLPGSLAQRLAQWSSLESIPDDLREIIKTGDLTEQIALAAMLTDHEVNQLGMAAALKLVSAPARQTNQGYWRSCATAILGGYAMPLPPAPAEKITNTYELEEAEMCISCADIYLWLARRREFNYFGPDEPHVRHQRIEWSNRIDEALLRKIDTSRQCIRCGRLLPLNHRYSICDPCYLEGPYRYNDDGDSDDEFYP